MLSSHAGAIVAVGDAKPGAIRAQDLDPGLAGQQQFADRAWNVALSAAHRCR